MQMIYSNEIRPFVRYAGKINPPMAYPPTETVAYDCRLIYTRSEGILQVNGRDWLLPAETLCILPPMTGYCMKKMNQTPFYLLNFDYLAEKNAPERAIPVAPKADANPDRVHQQVHFRDLPMLDEPIQLPMPGLSPMMQAMCDAYPERILYGRCEMNATLTHILVRVFRRLLSQDRTTPITDIIRYVQSHCTDNLTNRAIAEQFHYHPNYVNRLFVRHTGISLHRYLLNCRVEAAMERVVNSADSLTQISRESGFADLSHFSRCVKSVTGRAPVSFRK